jgi:hypothetical protein
MAFGHERDRLARRPLWAIVGAGVSVLGLLVAFRLWQRRAPASDTRPHDAG